MNINELEDIRFGLFSEKDLLDISICEIDNPKISTGDKNSSYGTIYDPRLGPMENGVKCPICQGDIWSCQGHFGHIRLNEPIIHPLFYKRVVDFLKCICIKCNQLLITEDQINLNSINKIKSSVKRFEKILEKLEKIDMCPFCSHPQPDIKYTSTDNNISMVYKQKDKGKISIVISPEEIKKTFDNITDEQTRLLGFDPALVHPSSLILTVFPVIPYCSRPYVLAEGQTCDDDLSVQLTEIIKSNNQLKIIDGIPISETKRQKALQTLKFRIISFYNNSGGRSKHTTSGRPLKGLKERITGKEGLIRSNILGKRCLIKGTKIILWNTKLKNVEDIKVGDIIIGDDGEKRTVINTCFGFGKMFKIEQNKGETYIVNSEHILSLKFTNINNIQWKEKSGNWVISWFDKFTFQKKSKKIKPNNEISKEKAYELMVNFKQTLPQENTIDISVSEYIKLSKSIKKLFFGYKCDKPVKWDRKNVDIDPYILGMWLGNGILRYPCFTLTDNELIDYWEKCADKNNLIIKKCDDIHFQLFNKNRKSIDSFLEKLKKYNLFENKHIPDDYIYNDIDTRLKLLAGLIDTDGNLENENRLISISKSIENKRILDGAKLIASSLGFQTSLKSKKISFTDNNIEKEKICVILYISGHGIEKIPTLSKTKKCLPPKVQILTRSNIKVFEYEDSEFYGFEVDANKRFLLADFTVCHNCEQTGRTVIGPDPTLKMGQIGVPEEMSKILTVPVQVTNYNYKEMNESVNNGQVNIVKKKNGEKILVSHHIFNKGTRLNHGDIIIRKDEKTGKEIEFIVNNGKEVLQPGDKLKRNNELITNIKYPEKKRFHLEIGDICERRIRNGDILLLNRQPTLHCGSMMAQEIVLHKDKTLRFNLAIAKSFNADESRSQNE